MHKTGTRRLLEMNILAIDIGGTAIKYAYMTQDMKILSKQKNCI